MPRYHVFGFVTVSGYTYVEARTATEALDIARRRPAALCPPGAKNPGDPWATVVIPAADGFLSVSDVAEVDESPPGANDVDRRPSSC